MTTLFSMPRCFQKRLFLAGISACSFATAAAQPASGKLEEITVTARKRSENLQKTPIAVTAFTAKQLQARGVANIADVGKYIPNVSLQAGAAISGSASTVTAFIRGIGQTDFTLTIDPGVGIYVDGVYVSRSTGALLATTDIASVEVLRGPQGTLFGKNTIGGAIVVTSQKPTDKLEGNIEGTTGSYDRADLTGMLNVPVSDQLQIRMNGSFLSRDGYVKRLQDGEEMGGQHDFGGRIAALYTPSPDLRFTLAVDATHDHDEGLGSTLVAVNPDVQETGFYNAFLSGVNCSVPTSNAHCISSRYITGNPYTTWNSSTNLSTLDLIGYSLTGVYDINPDLSLKSITAYRRFTNAFDDDFSDFQYGPVFNSRDNYQDRQFSQELTLSGTAFNSRLKWVAGGYLLKEIGVNRNYLTLAIADFLSGGYVDNDSDAAYAQATYSITDQIHLTLGGRYTYEDKRFTPDQYIELDRTGGELLGLSRLLIPAYENPDGNRILPDIQRSVIANEFTPAASLDYQVTPSILAYVSYDKGFKSGGFTQRVFPPLPQAPSFGPEFVTSYEIGVKSELLEDTLRLNLAAFKSSYKSLQVIVDTGIAPTVENAGDASISGFEAEGDYALPLGAHLNGGLGYTDAHYTQISQGAQAGGVLLGNKLPYVSKWNGTVGLSAPVWQGERGMLTVRVDGTYRSSYFPDAENNVDIKQGGYALMNASASFVPAGSRWTISAGGTNITSTKYQITGYSDLAADGVAYIAYARPAEWYLRAKYAF